MSAGLKIDFARMPLFILLAAEGLVLYSSIYVATSLRFAADAMAASAVALLTDPAHHQAVTEAALAAVLRRFCANAIVPLYVEFYSQVIDRRPVLESRP